MNELGALVRKARELPVGQLGYAQVEPRLEGVTSWLLPNSDCGDAMVPMEIGFEDGDDCGEVSKCILYACCGRRKPDTRLTKSRLAGNWEGLLVYDDCGT